MKIDKLKYLVSTLELIEDNPGKLSLEDIKRINPKMSSFFLDYCLGPEGHYVDLYENRYKLTRLGFKGLNQLQDRLDTAQSQERQISINLLIGLTGSALAIVALFDFLTKITFLSQLDLSIIRLIIGFIALILFVCIVFQSWNLINEKYFQKN